jgi:hypothetical protein
MRFVRHEGQGVLIEDAPQQACSASAGTDDEEVHSVRASDSADAIVVPGRSFLIYGPS